MMTQGEARALAKQRGGIARQGRKRPDGSWLLGGWTTPASQWIVELPTGVVLEEVTS